MKNSRITNNLIVWIVSCLLAGTSCSVEPTFHTEVAPEIFYTSQDAVWQRFNRSFTHWRWTLGQDMARWIMQELGTDEFCIPTRGQDWYDGAVWQKFHHQEYTEDMRSIDGTWALSMMGVALAWDAMEDLEEVDFEALGFASGTRESMVNQQKALAASFYLDMLDFWGGVPLYSTTRSEVKGRSTDVETFEFIENLLVEAIPNLPLKETLGARETGNINRAAGASLLARLYFNAEPYTGQNRYNDAAVICQDIIDGKYGKYELDSDWTNIFGFSNETCTEIIWSVPSQNAQTETGDEMWRYMIPSNFRFYLGGLDRSGTYNGVGLIPSLDPSGNKYPYRLGGAYSKFHDEDIRKQLYVYLGDGQYRGMFIVGELINPTNPEWVCTGIHEYSGRTLVIPDQVAHFSRVGVESPPNSGIIPFPTLESLPSTIANGEENSCVRVTKKIQRPNANESNRMFNNDVPIIRLAEIYYTLAECKMRAGDTQEAADLINTVRKRYFINGVDPDPVSAANLDKYRMLDEWQMEFLAEARRRTDLIRWDAYVTEDWWDKPANQNARHKHRFPIHYSIRNANQLLEQNPGY